MSKENAEMMYVSTDIETQGLRGALITCSYPAIPVYDCIQNSLKQMCGRRFSRAIYFEQTYIYDKICANINKKKGSCCDIKNMY